MFFFLLYHLHLRILSNIFVNYLEFPDCILFAMFIISIYFLHVTNNSKFFRTFKKNAARYLATEYKNLRSGFQRCKHVKREVLSVLRGLKYSLVSLRFLGNRGTWNFPSTFKIYFNSTPVARPLSVSFNGCDDSRDRTAGGPSYVARLWTLGWSP